MIRRPTSPAALQSCLRGVQLDERDPYGHYALAMTHAFSGALEPAIRAAEQAAALSPSFALAQLGLGMTRLYAGQAAEAIEPLERGLRLNPFDPQNFHWFRLQALACHFVGRDEDALRAALRAVDVRPSWRPAHETAALCYAALGRLEEARNCAVEMAGLEMPRHDILSHLKLRNPRWTESMAALLRQAGAAA
jgi:tetratricopeptide (TPR) repeat protein